MSASTQVTNINKQETMRRPRAYLGPPPLTAADDANAYYRVYDKIAQTQDNIDIMSEIWMVDITDLTIEVLRYRRMKAQFINYALNDAIVIHLSAVLDTDQSHDLVTKRVGGDKEACEKIESALKSANLSTEMLMAKVLVDQIEPITKIDVLTAAAEKRRNEAFHELERHSARLARSVRTASDHVLNTALVGAGKTGGCLTSEQKRRANRQNSLSSTGPRTAAGKAASVQNARRHGLRVPVLTDAAWYPQAVALANEIAGVDAGAERRDLALRVAEECIDVLRVRQARHDVIGQASPSRWTDSPNVKATDFTNIFRALKAKLAVLNEYERRALSRRKSAIRAFDDL